jgi:hypothetical protein
MRQPDPDPVLVVTGTRREASLVRGRGVVVLAGGGDAEELAAQIDAEVARHGAIAGIVSYGMAGSLMRGVLVGDLVIGTEVDGPVETPCDPDWVAALAAALPGARRGIVYADGRLLATRGVKSKVGRMSPAACADMESHVAAAAALRHGVPLAVLRAISDPHNVSLPPVVEVAMAKGGGLAPGAMLGSLLRSPRQLFALVGTLRQFGCGFAALRKATRRLDARLAFDQRGQEAPLPPPRNRKRRRLPAAL